MENRIIDRINIIRNRADLNKSKFERKISKSTGYLNMLEKKSGQPGADVILDIIEAFPDYNLNWLMTGEGSMLKKDAVKQTHTANETTEPYPVEKETTLLAVRDDLKRDLNELAKGMAKNFKVIADGLQTSMQRQEKLIDFVEKLDADKISKATGNLEEFLKSK